ncbi:phage Gp19/Gp15/Gp42 family protein [uncultured Subdoligranulum sp.]|uniref:phage Gp19/Gp15/Gp42 family protein n=1 Tax=uncultured Subdoligranulum sp. TaxID=512298 RepID=UPI0025F55669|nr:phage Gp19/Gp15/Gp42 family protein [uncultured Subdoligranulum sp.]
MNYATLDDITALWRAMTPAESKRAEALLPIVSASLRSEARKAGKDLDGMLVDDPDLAEVARSVTVDVVARTLMTSTDTEPLTQLTESAGGYSATGTFLVPGGGLFIKKSELARLGLRRQRYGVIDFYGNLPARDSCDPV